MATRSIVGLLDTELNTYRYVYVHWDGYLSGVGQELVTHFNDLSKVRTLLNSVPAGYYISSLEGPDKSELRESDNEVFTSFDNPLELLESYGGEFLYVYIKNVEQWYYCAGYGSNAGKFYELASSVKEAIKEEEEERCRILS